MARTGDWRPLPSAIRETVTSVQDGDRASLPGWDAAHASAGEFAVPHRFPGQPREQEDHGISESPEHVLNTVVSDLSRKLTCYAGWNSRLGPALVFRPWPLRSMHVVGGTPMAEALRRLIAAGAAPGWELHPVPGGRTALYVLAAPLYRLSGQQRFYNLLDRAGFAWVEEVAATPDVCLLELRNSGPKFIATARRAISELGMDGASEGPEGAEKCQDPGLASSPPALPPEVARALQLAARSAVAERGASIFGDLVTLAPGIAELPPDVARSWDRIRQLNLRSLTGMALPGHDLPRLAGRLLEEVADDRRRLILTSRTFAPERRTYDTLAAEFGISRGRVRQLEISALEQLAQAAMEDLYAPLRWRAASAVRAGAAPTAEVPDAPPWMGQLLSWLAKETA
jgi:Sigma-70, region 4